MTKLNEIMLLVCAAALFSGVASAAGTQIYKWTDAQGVVHYSDKAPAQTPQPVALITLPEFPPVDQKAEAADQAWIASINQWYENVLKQESQLQYEQFLAWQESQSSEPVPPATEQVSYVTPLCWDCGRFGFRHRPHDKMPSPRTPHAISPVFKSNIWSTQPNPFTQQLYKP
ncbi:MAG: DUF4124 domain-containing protein [Gammaproteobacteria bacterium]